MKLKRNKTCYTLYKGMGDVVIGEIIHYSGLGCRFSIIDKLSGLGLDLKDLKEILSKMEAVEKNFKNEKDIK